MQIDTRQINAKQVFSGYRYNCNSFGICNRAIDNKKLRNLSSPKKTYFLRN